MLHVLTRVNATLSTYKFDLSGTPVLKEARAGCDCVGDRVCALAGLEVCVRKLI